MMNIIEKQKWEQLGPSESTGYKPLDFALKFQKRETSFALQRTQEISRSICPFLTQSLFQNIERNRILTTRCAIPKFRTFDSCLDHNDNLMVKNSASLQVLIWGLYQRWPNRVADLLCSLERKVGLPSSLLCLKPSRQRLWEMSHTLSSRYWVLRSWSQG